MVLGLYNDRNFKFLKLDFFYSLNKNELMFPLALTDLPQSRLFEAMVTSVKRSTLVDLIKITHNKCLILLKQVFKKSHNVGCSNCAPRWSKLMDRAVEYFKHFGKTQANYWLCIVHKYTSHYISLGDTMSLWSQGFSSSGHYKAPGPWKSMWNKSAGGSQNQIPRFEKPCDAQQRHLIRR